MVGGFVGCGAGAGCVGKYECCDCEGGSARSYGEGATGGRQPDCLRTAFGRSFVGVPNGEAFGETIWKDICPGRWSTELLYCASRRTYACLAVKRFGYADRCIPELYSLAIIPRRSVNSE
jgi:hypothetical protein